MSKFKFYKDSDIEPLIRKREGEIKLGECLKYVHSLDELAQSSSKFVLLGIPEEIGVRANFGIGGTHTAWEAALKALVNIQYTSKLKTNELILLGRFDFSEEINKADQLDPNQPEELKALRELVEKIDIAVFNVLFPVFSAGKIPIIIGGGHNNSYPILKAFSTAHQQPVNTINIDAHTDFRMMEGRHSGNGFKYAFAENLLEKYAVIGLHENYNFQAIINEMSVFPNRILFRFYEDFIRLNQSAESIITEALQFTKGNCGLEVDLDSMANILSSAVSPSGFSVQQVRAMIMHTAGHPLKYLHLAEGAICFQDGREDLSTGKLISYLISDFIKAQV